MTVRSGKKYDYLGMILDFSEDGKLAVNMEGYLNEILSLNWLSEYITEVATIHAVDHLFKTRDDKPNLNKERATMFHHITTQVMFVVQRDRPTWRRLYHSSQRKVEMTKYMKTTTRNWTGWPSTSAESSSCA